MVSELVADGHSPKLRSLALWGNRVLADTMESPVSSTLCLDNPHLLIDHRLRKVSLID